MMNLINLFTYKTLLLTTLLITSSYSSPNNNKHGAETEDNDFAEFEDFDDESESVVIGGGSGGSEEERVGGGGGKVVEEEEEEGEFDDVLSEKDEVSGKEEEMTDDEDGVVEDDDSDFDHFQDEEEFEGYDSDRVGGKPDAKDGPKITIAKVPMNLRTNWDSYVLEIIMLSGLFVYFLNFFTGKSKNQRLANAWFNAHRTLLENNFALVGDDGKVECENQGVLIKESENMYTLWCSGRAYCEGMLVELKFLKRQDLVGVISQVLRPKRDQIHVKVRMNKDDMDTFVFFLGNKKTAALLCKEMVDLSTYCTEKKSGEKQNIPSSFVMLTEVGEVTSAMLDSKVVTILNQYEDLIDYIHFSDQYTGVRMPEETAAKLPDCEKMLLFGFNLPLKTGSSVEAMEQMRPLLQLVFHFIEKVKRFKLTKEGKNKADKNRARVEEAFLKTTHAARAEAAAARREEKKRQEKERIMQEEDPEKQRKWEEREMRRQLKKKGPKMKQLKVKAL